MARIRVRKTPTIVNELRDVRESLGMTKVELSQRMGVHAHAIGAYERGEHVPGADIVERWAAALGMDVVLSPRSTE